MKRYLLLLSLTLLAFCNTPTGSNSAIPTGDNIRTVESDDAAMNKAIETAKATFNNFDTAFKNGHFDPYDFSIKVRFVVDVGGEHIWANDIKWENGAYYGVLSEDAAATDKVKAGDKVRISMDNLSDWLYGDNGILRGGHTIRVLRNKMSPSERQAFDSSYYLKIVD